MLTACQIAHWQQPAPLAAAVLAPQAQAGGDPYHPMPAVTAHWDRLSYYASVTWVDSQIGRVLDQLDTVKATPETLIILHSDHGSV